MQRVVEGVGRSWLRAYLIGTAADAGFECARVHAVSQVLRQLQQAQGPPRAADGPGLLGQ